ESAGPRASIARLADDVPADSRVELVAAGGSLAQFTADLVSGLGWCSPRYGRVEPATTLRVSRRDIAPFWIASVFGFDAENPIADVELVPVQTNDGKTVNSTGLRISRLSSIDRFVASELGSSHASAPRRFDDVETAARMCFARTATGKTTRIELT